MFLTLLLVTLVLAVAVSIAVSLAFNRPISRILSRIIADDISAAWVRYLKFAILVVGVSSGVRIHELERYITPNQWQEEPRIIELTSERWVLEVYRTIIETLQGIAWMLLVFFCIALVAYVIVRIFESRKVAAPPVADR
ncbi:hypothetical protein E4582_06080 [Luteimonas yindakuii]|uniref:Uncharacterized protein n=1 Tax=Luteimonas yindakuii TaxID=2565782 RepID=A0A4Z1R4F8_9GAMM|nr:hypothetical protein [Luteimonas yindakuii]TKS54380.1 hypothetical protein E4582_06080 [Luteimonas yindakuii]